MNLTFEQAVAEYLEYIKLKRKEVTYLTHEDRIKKHIRPFFKNKLVSEISKNDILKWQVEIDKLGFKYNYKSSIFYSLSSIYNFLENFYNVDNIVKKVGNFRNDDISDNGNIWTYEEYKKFINCVDDYKFKILFEILYFTGLRKGEIMALKKDDIDLYESKITINKSITRNHKINTPKTKTSTRIISIDNTLTDEIKKYIENFNISDNLFDISFSTLKRKKDYYCKIANVKQIKIHEFRHSHACLLFKNNVPIDEISYRLGHSKISITTDTYLRYLPKQEKRVISTLNSLRFN